MYVDPTPAGAQGDVRGDVREEVVARRARGWAACRRTGRGDGLVAVGAIVFTVGLLATLVTMVPFFVGSDPFPTAVYLLALLAPVGFAVALVGLLRAARSRGDAQR